LNQQLDISYSRAKHTRTVLNLLFAYALRQDALGRNPVEGTSPLVRPPGTPQALTLEQIAAIRLAAATWRTGPHIKGPKPDGQVRDALEVLLGTSARTGEALAIRPVDVRETKAGMVVRICGIVDRTSAGVSMTDRALPSVTISRDRYGITVRNALGGTHVGCSMPRCWSSGTGHPPSSGNPKVGDRRTRAQATPAHCA
jgi:site-specific recombinase XerD